MKRMPAPFFVRHGCIAGILCLMYGQAPGGLSVIRRECEGRPFLRGAGGEAAAPYFPGRELKRGFFAGVRGGYAAPEGCEGATTGAFAARLPAKKRRRLPGQLKIWEILTACKRGRLSRRRMLPSSVFPAFFGRFSPAVRHAGGASGVWRMRNPPGRSLLAGRQKAPFLLPVGGDVPGRQAIHIFLRADWPLALRMPNRPASRSDKSVRRGCGSGNGRRKHK